MAEVLLVRSWLPSVLGHFALLGDAYRFLDVLPGVVKVLLLDALAAPATILALVRAASVVAASF